MSNNIKKSVKYLVNKYDTRNPEKIAEGEGIEIIHKPYSKGTKGYFISVNDRKHIVLNDSLDSDTMKVVLSHELGHAMHHNDHNIYFIREHTFLSTKVYEDEANNFAAELLIDDDDLDEITLKDMSIEQVSKCLKVTPELVEYKIKKK